MVLQEKRQHGEKKIKEVAKNQFNFPQNRAVGGAAQDAMLGLGSSPRGSALVLAQPRCPGSPQPAQSCSEDRRKVDEVGVLWVPVTSRVTALGARFVSVSCGL